jgi:hypothetical protein
MCPIPASDIENTTLAIQNKTMLLTTLTQAYNELQKSERDKFVKEKMIKLSIADSGKNTPEFYKNEAMKHLPGNLLMLPEQSIIVQTDKILEKLGKQSDIVNFDDIEAIKLAFIQAYSDEVAFRGSVEGTFAGSEHVERFVAQSAICVEANTMLGVNNSKNSSQVVDFISYNSKPIKSFAAGSGNNTKWVDKSEKNTVNSESHLDSICTWIPAGKFYMTKLAADRKDSANFEIKRMFASGLDPLALAFKIISDRIAEKALLSDDVILSAYSPKRRDLKKTSYI